MNPPGTAIDAPPPELRPALFFGVGPAAAQALAAARQKMRKYLGEIPPFFSFLQLQSDEASFTWRRQTGEQAETTGEKAAGLELNGIMADWLQAALREITSFRVNRECFVPPGFRAQFEALDVIMVASLEELPSLAPVTSALRAALELYPESWRLGLFWSAPLTDASRANQSVLRERLDLRLKELDDEQSGLADVRGLPLFGACFLLGEPEHPGWRTLGIPDMVDITSSLLAYFSATRFGDTIRPLFLNQTAPCRFHLGFLCRCFDPKDIAESLRRQWLARAYEIWKATDLPDSAGSAASATLAVEALIDEPSEKVERAVDTYLDSVLRDAEGLSGTESATAAGLGGEDAKFERQPRGFLHRARFLTDFHIAEIWRLHDRWRHKGEELNHELAKLNLNPPRPARGGTPPPPPPEDKPIWLIVLLLAGGCGLIVGGALMNPPSVALMISGGVGLIMGGVVGLWPRKQPPPPAPPPPPPPFVDPRAAIRRKLKIVAQMVEDPEAFAEMYPPRPDPAPLGLWRTSCRLGQLRQNLEMFETALRQRIEANARFESWFVRAILPDQSQEELFQSVLQRFLESEGGAGLAAPAQNHGDGPVLHSLHTLMRDGGLALALQKDYRCALESIEAYERKFFASFESWSLRDFLDMAKDPPTGADGVAAFFNDLARGGRMLLWQFPPGVNRGEWTHLLHSDVWDGETIGRAAKIIDQCKPTLVHVPGEIALIRVVQGEAWRAPGTLPADHND